MKHILLFIFVFLILADPVYGANFKDVAANAKYIEEINNLSELGIMQGDNQNFRPNDTITRAEFAAVLCRALKLDTNAEEMKQPSSFSDVKADFWALPYINAAVKNGMVKGFDDGTFRPSASVTNEQVIKMIIAGYGFTEEAEKLGGYPNGYFEIAKRYGITNKVLFNYGTASKRFVVAIFTAKALSKFTESIEDTAKEDIIQPIPELVEVDNPIQILSKVTLQSARFERKVFEQRWDLKKAPFYIKDKSFIYKYDTANKIVNITIPGNNKTILLSKNMTSNRVNCSLPEGRWKLVFYTQQNHIRDTYFGYVQVDSKGNLTIENELWRYTTLQVQPKVTEDIKQIDSFSETYLKAVADKSDDGKIVFTFTGESLAKGRHMSINISYKFVDSIGNESVDFWGGKDQKVQVSLVVPVQEIYYFDSSIIDAYGQDVIKGELKLDPATDEVLFNGNLHKFTTEGFEYTD